jgi:hypothetical protein
VITIEKKKLRFRAVALFKDLHTLSVLHYKGDTNTKKNPHSEAKEDKCNFMRHVYTL